MTGFINKQIKKLKRIIGFKKGDEINNIVIKKDEMLIDITKECQGNSIIEIGVVNNECNKS